MVSITQLIDQIIGNLDKLTVGGLESMAIAVKCYQDLKVVREGVEKLEEEMRLIHGQGNDIQG